jgi:inner membrane protein
MTLLPDAVARAPGLKFLLVCVITLAMAVPLYFIFLVLSERQQSAQLATDEVSHAWGGAQTIGGPLLAVPYFQSEHERANAVRSAWRYAVFLPKSLNAKAKTKTELRARGIFEVKLYAADIELGGSFARPDFSELGVNPALVAWDQAVVLLPISDLRGLSDNVSMVWGAAKSRVPFRPRLIVKIDGYTGIHAPVALSPDGGETPFSLNVSLRGSHELKFAAAGLSSTVTVSGDWPHPSFSGNFLPSQRDVSDDGFSAVWKVPHLASDMTQSLLALDGLAARLNDASLGVSFYQPVTFYVLVQRALKYALLSIGFAFLSFFLIETLSGARIHGVQYVLIGGAQVIFYMLLLSLAEQIGFEAAYFLASAATVCLISGYSVPVLKGRVQGLVVLGVLSILYTLLFVLLKQEDYALVIGALAAFAGIAVTMYVTRNIDWYQINPGIPAWLKPAGE